MVELTNLENLMPLLDFRTALNENNIKIKSAIDAIEESGGGGGGEDGKSAYDLYVDNFVPVAYPLYDYILSGERPVSDIKKLNFSPSSTGDSPHGSELTIVLNTSDEETVTISFTDEEINIVDSFGESAFNKKILNSDILSLSEKEYVFSIKDRMYEGMPVTFIDVYTESSDISEGDPLTLINTTVLSEVLPLNEWLESLKGKDGAPGGGGTGTAEIRDTATKLPELVQSEYSLLGIDMVGTDNYGLVDTSNKDNPPCVGMNLGLSVEGYYDILLFGTIENSNWAFISGKMLWVDNSNGGLTQIKPTEAGQIIQCVGRALTSTKILFNPSTTWVEV